MSEETQIPPLLDGEQLIDQNQADLDELDKKGLDVEVLVDRLRLAVLTELTLPANSPLRNTYEQIFQINLAQHLEQAKAHVARQEEKQRSDEARSTLLDGVKTQIPKGALM